MSNKVTALTLENSMLQARVLDLEDELQKLKAIAEKKDGPKKEKPA